MSERCRKEAIVAWTHIAHGLASSDDAADRALAESVDRYVRATPFAVEYAQHLEKHREQPQLTFERGPSWAAKPVEQAPEIRR